MRGHGPRQSELPLGGFQRLSFQCPVAEQSMLHARRPMTTSWRPLLEGQGSHAVDVCVLGTSIGLPQCLACSEASGNVNLQDATPAVCCHCDCPNSTWALCCIVARCTLQAAC